MLPQCTSIFSRTEIPGDKMSYYDHSSIINKIFIAHFADRNVIFIDVVVTVQFFFPVFLFLFSQDYHLLRSTLSP